MTQVAVVNLGTGNLRSVARAVEHVSHPATKVQITREPDIITRADRLVLPGQGAIGSWLQALADQSLKSALIDSLNNKPVLAICVGMQALFDYNSEDGGHECLGFFKGEVVRFEDGKVDAQGLTMKVPQIGWNQVFISQPHPLWKGIEDGSWFYFLHSYYAKNTDDPSVVGMSEYGITYTSAIAENNIFAIQCHPEKSHNVGLKLIENFMSWKC